MTRTVCVKQGSALVNPTDTTSGPASQDANLYTATRTPLNLPPSHHTTHTVNPQLPTTTLLLTHQAKVSLCGSITSQPSLQRLPELGLQVTRQQRPDLQSHT